MYGEIVETGKNYVLRATLSTRTAAHRFSRQERQDHGTKAGARVISDPKNGTPAAKAGLCIGDVIVGFNGLAVDEPGDLYAALDRTVIGIDCHLEYLRDGKRHKTTIVPAERARERGRG